MDGPAWKRQRMDDGPGGPSRQDSVFYKTRMCHKYVPSPAAHATRFTASIVKAVGHQQPSQAIGHSVNRAKAHHDVREDSSHLSLSVIVFLAQTTMDDS